MVCRKWNDQFVRPVLEYLQDLEGMHADETIVNEFSQANYYQFQSVPPEIFGKFTVKW